MPHRVCLVLVGVLIQHVVIFRFMVHLVVRHALKPHLIIGILVQVGAALHGNYALRSTENGCCNPAISISVILVVLILFTAAWEV